MPKTDDITSDKRDVVPQWPLWLVGGVNGFKERRLGVHALNSRIRTVRKIDKLKYCVKNQ